MTRKLLVALAPLSGTLLLALCAAPAVADTAFVTHPVSVRGYTMRIVADTGGGGVSVTLFRRVGGSIQQHTWDADRRFRLTASRSLRRRSLRARFGTRGRINLKFRARARASRGRVPWCDKRRRRIAGTLSGRFKLRTGPGRFGTVVRRHLHAWLSRGPKFGFYCFPPDPQPDSIANETFPPAGPVLHANLPPDRYISIWNATGGGTVESAVFSPRVSETHEIVAHSHKSVFSYSSDLRSASAAGIGPFFSGALSFTRTGVFGGSVAGDFRAALVAPAPFTITSGAPADLELDSP